MNSRPRAQISPAAFVAVLGLLLTAISYLASLRFDFVYDDFPQIVSNAAVHSWRYLPGYFSHQLWNQLYPDWAGNYYRPLFMLWLRINDALFGSHPLGWHATSILAHLVATAMVFWLAKRLTGDSLAAAIASLLFGVHPAHVESVAWISGATDPLLALAIIPSFVFWMNAAERREHRAKWIAFSMLMFALALLVKETAIVVPGLIFFHELLPDPFRDRPVSISSRFRDALLAALPFVALAVAYLAVRRHVLKAAFGTPDVQISALAIVQTWPSLAWFYLRHLFAIGHMSLFYDVGYVREVGFRNFWLPAIATLLIVLGIAACARLSRDVAIAALWTVLFLLPPLVSIGILGSGEIAHDRYLYLPSVGVCILAALALRALPSQREWMQLPSAQFAVAGVLAIVLAAATAAQSLHWANNLLLYYDATQHAPNNSVAQIALGNEMLARKDVDSARRMYYLARSLEPDSWQANFHVAFIDFATGRFAEAEKYWRDAIRIQPANPNQFLYLGLTLMNEGRLDEAAAAIQHGSDLWPRGPVFHYGLALVAQRQGNLQLAAAEYRKELAIAPAEGVYRNLAEVERQIKAQSGR